MIFNIFMIAFLCAVSLPGLVVSSVMNEAAGTPNVGYIAGDDPLMIAAGRKAREGLDDFLDKLENPPPRTDAYAVKIGFADKGDHFAIVRDHTQGYVEYIWVTDIISTANGFVGRIDNDPENIRNVVSGQYVMFEKEDIFDWSYLEDGKVRGNATACPLLLKGPKEELDYSRDVLGMAC